MKKLVEFKKELAMYMLADYMKRIEDEISSQLSNDNPEDFLVAFSDALNQDNFHANASYMLYSLSNGYNVKIV